MPYTFAITEKKRYHSNLQKFLEICEEKNAPAFESMYWFTKGNLDNRTIDRESAIIDTIMFDIDGPEHATGTEDALAETRKFLEAAKEFDFEVFVNFSGNSGFRIEVPFNVPEIKHRYETVRLLYQRFQEVFDVDLDMAAQLGTAQKFRIQNSKHQKSGLYAVPLTNEEVVSLSFEQIKELAKDIRIIDRNYDTAKETNTAITEICQKLDASIGGRKKTTNVEASQIKQQFKHSKRLRPCTQNIINTKQHSFVGQSIVAFEMLFLGTDDSEIHEWAKTLDGIEGHTYSKDITQYHINRIKDKLKNASFRPHGCSNIKRNGFCVNLEADNLEQCMKIMRIKYKEDSQKTLRSKLNEAGANPS